MAGFAPRVTVGRFGYPLAAPHRATYRLAATHRAAIEAAIPPGVSVGPEVWQDLEETFGSFECFRDQRVHYQIKAERRRWGRIGTHTAKLKHELRQLPPGPWRDQALGALTEIDTEVKVYAAYHATWGKFKGTRNPDDEFLYSGVLRVWIDRLGGKPTYTRPVEGGPPSGDAIDFFAACVGGVLGDATPNEHGIASIIDRLKSELGYQYKKEV
jgi:hypothetical protein